MIPHFRISVYAEDGELQGGQSNIVNGSFEEPTTYRDADLAQAVGAQTGYKEKAPQSGSRGYAEGSFGSFTDRTSCGGHKCCCHDGDTCGGVSCMSRRGDSGEDLGVCVTLCAGLYRRFFRLSQM